MNFTDEPSTALRGVLWSTRGPWLVLRDATLLKHQEPPTKLDGEVLIHRDRVSFVQVP